MPDNVYKNKTNITTLPRKDLKNISQKDKKWLKKYYPDNLKAWNYYLKSNINNNDYILY
ncbi:hypothetical protein [Ligilactobacillus salivarius]|uniref:hypothetical protein n=1 Tax=Ligilactobacillus salivarius TaxID=1624 RepID=UPI0012FC4754|nr:hypothetical protein [Ligilactobacillus salivarius]UHL93221.1 hypothetical protein LVD18_02540 [Ligilactobacillus salivarius]